MGDWRIYSIGSINLLLPHLSLVDFSEPTKIVPEYSSLIIEEP
jgi:hypothetical protein